MAGWWIRPAGSADFGGIAGVARASGLADAETGSDPAYLRHLLAHGRVMVAVSGHDGAEEVFGFAAALPVGPMTMLADLFVRPDGQGRGAGAALLVRTVRGAAPADPPDVVTFSSADPRAIGLYAGLGMSARWALLYLRGDPASLPVPVGMSAEPVDPARAAGHERAFTGIDRSDEYAYWAGRTDGSCLEIRGDTGVLAVGSLGGAGQAYGLSHLSLAPGTEPVPPLLAALRRLDRPGLVCLPSPHPAVPELLRHGYRIEDHDLFMTTGPDLPAGTTGVYAPGFC